jgi:hypothetical protein
VIAVGVGDHQMGDPLTRGQSSQDRVDVLGGFGRPWVDHPDVAPAHQVGAGAEISVRTGVVGHHSPDQGRHALHYPVADLRLANVRDACGHEKPNLASFTLSAWSPGPRDPYDASGWSV